MNLKLNHGIWLVFDRVVYLVLNFVLSVYLARSLGIELFGMYSYALSLAAIFAVFGHMGIPGLAVQQYLKSEYSRDSIMGATAVLKLVGLLIGLICFILYCYFFERSNVVLNGVLIYVGLIIIFKIYEIYEFWFESQLQGVYIATTKITLTLIFVAFKVVCIEHGLRLKALIIADSLYFGAITLILATIYKINTRSSIFEWQLQKDLLGRFIRNGWPIYIGTFFYLINLKIDQVMMRWMSTPNELGFYAVAAQLSEAWYFIPIAIMSAFFPSLIKGKEGGNAIYSTRLTRTFSILIYLSITVSILVTANSSWVILFLYGEQYSSSSAILNIHIWASVFVFVRVGISKWIIIEGLFWYSLFSQGLGAIVNIALNYFLIPLYGGEGAAVSTLFSYFVSGVLALCFFPKTRQLLIVIASSFFLRDKWL